MIYFCADDAGINSSQLGRIAVCSEKGALNAASVFGNSSMIPESVALLRKRCRVSLHLNLCEGRAVSSPDRIPLLADRDGVFYASFLRLLLLSYLKGREVEEQSYVECKAQLERFLACMDQDYRIRIDSHRHMHMIPTVCRGMCRALRESGRQVENIRYPVERIGIYITTPSVWRYISPVNVLKVIVLNSNAGAFRKILRAYGFDRKPNLFCGIAFAGRMVTGAVRPVLGKLQKTAKKEGRSLELLFHPGGVKKGEQYLNGDSGRFAEFYESADRRAEAKTLIRLKKEMGM